MQKVFNLSSVCSSALLAAVLFSTSSCGWHCIDHQNRSTLAIPYVEGDSTGTLTSFLTEEIEKNGQYRCHDENNSYILKVKLCDDKYENIGFRYDPEKQENKKIIASETRSKILAEICIVEAATNKVLLGPAHILATYDYDHQNYSMNSDINLFSMGQLTDIDTAKGVIDTPLYRNLAQEIGKYLASHPISKCSRPDDEAHRDYRERQ